MTTINFQEIKNQIIERGLAHADAINNATQQVIVVNGEWRRDDTIKITGVSAGFIVSDFVKAVAIRNELPQNLTSKQEIIDLLQTQCPGAKIIAKVL